MRYGQIAVLHRALPFLPHLPQPTTVQHHDITLMTDISGKHLHSLIVPLVLCSDSKTAAGFTCTSMN